MDDPLDAELQAIVIDSWGLIDDLARRKQKITDKVLRAAYEAFSAHPDVRALTGGGSSLCPPNGKYFGVQLQQDGLKDAAQTWVEVKPDETRMAIRVYCNFKSTAATIGFSEVKRRCLETLGSTPSGWEHSSQRSTAIFEVVRVDKDDLDTFAQRVADVAVQQLAVSKALASIVASNRK